MMNIGISNAYGASEDGSVIVGSGLVAGQTIAAMWSAEEGPTNLGYLPGGNRSIAYAVSADGSVISGTSTSSSSPTFSVPFRWTQSEGFVPLGTWMAGAQPFDCYASGISADGLTLVGSMPNAAGLQQAFRWVQAEGLSGLGTELQSSAFGVSSDGSIIVGYTFVGGCSAPFRWSHSTGLVALGDCISNSYAQCVSADGDMIGGRYLDGSFIDPGAFWTPERGWRSLHDVLVNDFGVTAVNGWYIDRITGISADGQHFVGSGYNPQGQLEGWIAFIPRRAPCPADVNGDRHVDLSDLAQLLSIFGATPSSGGYSLACDIDRNGVVDLSDLATVLANFGEVCP